MIRELSNNYGKDYNYCCEKFWEYERDYLWRNEELNNRPNQLKCLAYHKVIKWLDYERNNKINLKPSDYLIQHSTDIDSNKQKFMNIFPYDLYPDTYG